MIKQSVQAYGTRLNVKNRGQISDEMLDLQVYPHGNFPVIYSSESEERLVENMRYSLVPRWSKVEKPKFATYNARLETISEKPTWSKPLEEHRCLVAFNGFFESCYGGTHDGHIVKFNRPEGALMIAAGIFDNWVNKESGEVIDSFAIVTTQPSPFIEATGHDRSPLFLDDSDWDEWLGNEKQPAQKWSQFLKERGKIIDLEVESIRPLKSKK